MMHRISCITTRSPKQIYGKLVKNIYEQIKLRIVSVQQGGKKEVLDNSLFSVGPNWRHVYYFFDKIIDQSTSKRGHKQVKHSSMN